MVYVKCNKCSWSHRMRSCPPAWCLHHRASLIPRVLLWNRIQSSQICLEIKVRNRQYFQSLLFFWLTTFPTEVSSSWATIHDKRRKLNYSMKRLLPLSVFHFLLRLDVFVACSLFFVSPPSCLLISASFPSAPASPWTSIPFQQRSGQPGGGSAASQLHKSSL